MRQRYFRLKTALSDQLNNLSVGEEESPSAQKTFLGKREI